MNDRLFGMLKVNSQKIARQYRTFAPGSMLNGLRAHDRALGSWRSYAGGVAMRKPITQPGDIGDKSDRISLTKSYHDGLPWTSLILRNRSYSHRTRGAKCHGTRLTFSRQNQSLTYAIWSEPVCTGHWSRRIYFLA